jgi:hypothetical protein
MSLITWFAATIAACRARLAARAAYQHHEAVFTVHLDCLIAATTPADQAWHGEHAAAKLHAMADLHNTTFGRRHVDPGGCDMPESMHDEALLLQLVRTPTTPPPPAAAAP